ncbi:ATP-binding protein [Streptomyces sp. NPDC001985]|uniref:ATP-binding protein n=1 Tax=Streptomyces sp. NPDC001985 TaxID=3154406 RepID=UPI00331C75C7
MASASEAQLVRSLNLCLAVEPAEISGIRHTVIQRLLQWNLAALSDDVTLVVSELLANVQEHAEGICELHVQLADQLLVVSVTDTVTATPALRRPSGIAEAGRGLLLVDALTDHWETTLTATGKVITCTFSTPERGVSP